MDEDTVAREVVAPWLVDLEDLSHWFEGREVCVQARQRVGGRQQAEDLLSRVRLVFEAVAACEQGLPAEMKGLPADAVADSPGLDRLLHGMDARRPPGYGDVCRTREAILRLTVWRTLRRWQRCEPEITGSTSDFGSLLGRIAVRMPQAPPGVAVSLDYAPRATLFFNEHVRAVLTYLAREFPAARDPLRSLIELPDFDDTGVSVQRWSRAWTVAVAGIYIDWLRQHARHGLDGVLEQVWGAGSGCRRFKRTPAALPTEDKGLRLDLWTGLMHAQVLAHDPARFRREAEGHRWHRVPLALHRLSSRDTHAAGQRGRQTVYRGLSVEMIYEVVFADCMAALHPSGRPVQVSGLPSAVPPSGVSPASFPAFSVAQQPNVLLIQRWQGWPTWQLPATDQPTGTTRRSQVGEAVALSAAQRAILNAWRSSQGAACGVACIAEPELLCWRSAASPKGPMPGAESCDQRLGDACLWALAGADGQWFELDCAVRWQGVWIAQPLLLQDEPGAELRTSVWLDPDCPLPPALSPARLRRALADGDAHRWAVSRCGLGAFVLCAIDLDRPA